MWVPSLDQEDPLEEGMATHSSVLPRRIPWTDGPGGLWSILPGESHGQRAPVSCGPWGHKESDMTEAEQSTAVIF